MSNALLASKIVIQEEEPRIRTIAGVQTSVTGMLGVTEKGPVGVATLLTGPDDYDRIFGGYVADGHVRQAADGFFQNGGAQLWVTRTVHYADVTDPTSKTSAAALVMLQTGATSASGGYVTSSNAGPYNFEPNDTLIVDTEAASPQTITFTATAAARETTNSGASPFALANADVLTVKIDGGGAQSITFGTASFADITNATAAEIAAVINAALVGGRATVTNTNKVTITSDKRGSGSHVEVTGGTANAAGKLNFATAAVDGTGNVANIDSVTVTEIIAAIVANGTLNGVNGVDASNVGGYLKIARDSSATGASATVQVTAGSTTDTIIGLDNAIHIGSSGDAVDTLEVDGKYDGTYAHLLKAQIGAATSAEAARFNLYVLKSGLIVETWPNLTMDSDDDRYVETIINASTTGSKYISVADQVAGTGAASTDRPVNVTSAFLSGGDDGLTSLADTDFTGATSDDGKTGMRCFDLVQELNLLTVPGWATSAVHNAMLTYCEVTRDMSVFGILDPPADQSATEIITYYESTAAVLGLSEFGAAYWPRVKVLNPSTSVFGKTADGQITVPPSGHIAGVMARTDAKKLGGVYVPPAGIENGILLGVLGFETSETLEEEKRDLVFPKRINPLTAFKGGVRHIDGARTLKSNGNFPSVPERRGAIFIEQSVKDGLQFARQKNNDEALRATCDRTVTAFMLTQMKNGAFRSNDPAKAFFVDFGDALNTASVQFAGQLVGRIGIATKKIAEYVILRFSQDTRALEEELAA